MFSGAWPEGHNPYVIHYVSISVLSYNLILLFTFVQIAMSVRLYWSLSSETVSCVVKPFVILVENNLLNLIYQFAFQLQITYILIH